MTSLVASFGRSTAHHSFHLMNAKSTSHRIEPASPWKNGYCESFNSKLRDECLNGEIFYSLKEAQIVIECWRVHYNTIRPHSSLGYPPPAPETIRPPQRDHASALAIATQTNLSTGTKDRAGQGEVVLKSLYWPLRTEPRSAGASDLSFCSTIPSVADSFGCVEPNAGIVVAMPFSGGCADPIRGAADRLTMEDRAVIIPLLSSLDPALLRCATIQMHLRSAAALELMTCAANSSRALASIALPRIVSTNAAILIVALVVSSGRCSPNTMTPPAIGTMLESADDKGVKAG